MNRRFAWIVAVGCLAACSQRGGSSPGDEGDPAADGGAQCASGYSGIRCEGDTALHCSDGALLEREACGGGGGICVNEVGCLACPEGARRCRGDNVEVCRDGVEGWEVVEHCDPAQGERCEDEEGPECIGLCAEARKSNSYIGCEYWPVTTTNSSLQPEFDFAVVVANPQEIDAEVTVEREGETVASGSVPSGGLETFRLPWVAELKQIGSFKRSALVRGGAYRLRSSVPVTVYQFNPLQYRIDRSCSGRPSDDDECFSFSNDASLLLPSHVLTGNYVAMSRPSMVVRRDDRDSWTRNPGFVAVVGIEEGETDVQVRFGAHTQSSRDEEVERYAPGDTGHWSLGLGDVLQVVSAMPTECPAGSPSDGSNTYCDMGDDYDLTGTEIEASGKVAVLSGHNCAFVPFDKWACDHLEQQLFPLEAWGKELLVAISEPLRDEPDLVRVLSGTDGNEVAFEPPVHEAVTLDRGQFVELEARQDFEVRGSEALTVAQFLVGQNYAGDVPREANGDPSMTIVIPTEQFREQYTFLTPESYEQSFVNVTAPAEQTVTLDGMPVDGWQEVGTTGNATARVTLSPGTHLIDSDEPFGITVYGFGSYTSYMYPGGLDLEKINAPF